MIDEPIRSHAFLADASGGVRGPVPPSPHPPVPLIPPVPPLPRARVVGGSEGPRGPNWTPNHRGSLAHAESRTEKGGEKRAGTYARPS
jgi:hypothetical protein